MDNSNDYNKIYKNLCKKHYNPDNKNFIVENFELTKNIGFNNIGHTCYMNSFLQILLHTPSFLPNLKKLYKNNIEKTTLVYNLIKLSECPKNNIFLYNIKSIISKTHQKYENFTQNDSQIFAIDFIDSIINEIKSENSFISNESIEAKMDLINEKECINFKKKKFTQFISDYEKEGEKTFIEDLFLFCDSMFLIKDKKLDPENYKFDLLLNIELTFPINKKKNNYTLYELLDNKYTKSIINVNITSKLKKKKNNVSYFQRDIVKEFYLLLKHEIYYLLNNFLLYKICKKNESKKGNKKLNNLKNNKSKEIYKILTLPKILIISFVRGIEGKELINSSVSFNDILNMENYIDEDLYDIKLGTIYKLYAINLREGKTKSFGHYYSYIKIENDWICYNDNKTYSIKPNYCLDNVVGLYYIKNNSPISE